MTSSFAFRPRRSCLYMPGANPRALEKAKGLPADMLVLDLEDAVAPEQKAEARETVAAVVKERAYGTREVLVRINSLDSEWGQEDLLATVAAGPDGILVPKIRKAADILALEDALTIAGASGELGLWSMIEMPEAILNIADIAATAGTTRLRGFVVGANDLAKELGALATPDRRAFQVHLALTLAAARAHGLIAIDAVFNDFRDESGLRAECEQGRIMGFDGKSLIHPAQLEAANELFSPDSDAVAKARAIIEAFALPENENRGVIKVDGAMVELLHLEQARRLVAISEAIDAS